MYNINLVKEETKMNGWSDWRGCESYECKLDKVEKHIGSRLLYDHLYSIVLNVGILKSKMFIAEMIIL